MIDHIHGETKTLGKIGSKRLLYAPGTMPYFRVNHAYRNDEIGLQDVLIRPKHSTLQSRTQVSLERTYKQTYAKAGLEFPIIAANMGPHRTFLPWQPGAAKHQLLTAIAKFATLETGKHARTIIQKQTLTSRWHQ